jgi:hypothetical protein
MSAAVSFYCNGINQPKAKNQRRIIITMIQIAPFLHTYAFYSPNGQELDEETAHSSVSQHWEKVLPGGKLTTFQNVVIFEVRMNIEI